MPGTSSLAEIRARSNPRLRQTRGFLKRAEATWRERETKSLLSAAFKVHCVCGGGWEMYFCAFLLHRVTFPTWLLTAGGEGVGCKTSWLPEVEKVAFQGRAWGECGFLPVVNQLRNVRFSCWLCMFKYRNVI